MNNNLPTDDNQKPVTSIETPPPVPEAPSVIPENPEPTIEIGSLDQPSLSTIQDVGGKSNNKSKKIKSIASILGLLLIITALPLAVVLVKQRQGIRKEAASGSVTVCGVTISTAGSGNFNGSSFTGNYSLNNTSGKNVEMTIRLDGCACDEGNLGQCNDNCIGENRNITLPPGTSTQSITTPSKNNCGTFQTDIKVMSCRQL